LHENGTNGELHGSHSNGTDGSHVNKANQKAVPVAICGIGLRLPGGSSTPQEFWEFLVNKGDGRGRVPTSRYNVSAYHETSKRPTTVATEYGYFLDEDIKLGEMDTTRFSMSRADVENADPQQRRLLEVVSEAFEDAGEAKFRVCAVLHACQGTKKAANNHI
jgi:acyl transferase domain-containing protein